MKKCAHYLHSEHYMQKNRTHINFAKNEISVCQGTVAVQCRSKLK